MVDPQTDGRTFQSLPDGEALFRDLHVALTRFLLEKIQAGEVTGEQLRQARELLRDNGITDAGRGAPGRDLRDLQDAVSWPFSA